MLSRAWAQSQVARVSFGRRLELAQNNQTIDAVDTPEKDSKLSQRAGRFSLDMEIDETAGHEMIRGVRDDDDTFEPEFEVDSPEMDAWIERVTAEEVGEEEEDE